MRWYYRLPLRLRSLFLKDRAELDLSDELQFHLQNQIDEFVAQGMNPQEARRDDPCVGCSVFLARLARNPNRSHSSATGGMIFSVRLDTHSPHNCCEQGSSHVTLRQVVARRDYHLLF
jgi:hypothetical protein